MNKNSVMRVAITALVLAACGNGAAALSGRWVLVDNVKDVPQEIEFQRDGLAIIDGERGWIWKASDTNFDLFSPGTNLNAGGGWNPISRYSGD